MFDIDALRFAADGLIPAIVQDFHTGQVLMMAYMNRESLTISLEEKRTCFWSRSRQELWRKGKTSGNTQAIVSIHADCDSDTLLVKVIPQGPACHTGEQSCFFNEMARDDAYREFSADALYSLLQRRKAEKKEGSYTTYLFEKGEDKILKKIGEECTEVVIAAKNDDKAETVYEIADLAYHTMVLMVQKGITLNDIRSELASRHVVDKKVKQERMGGEG
ncbi:bifunctional phosphoribosyl-AMP cyclohydrolase/phosphoribosyl-ATP diphosphatase HisIE [Ruminococcaceae bacterium OttesenSCG-928-L11]|nr:bifunctional phosphoribosyl-AMP cyclohydrolase/phosphoribosyl-ATP diphosphatase HisIE [Ruminococcaceae bacterium OttesenSCG-928-L11]